MERHKSWFKGILALFPALASRNYRLYFGGQVISMIGTWLQFVAQGWLVLKLANSAFYVGLVAAVSSLPAMFLSLFGGVIVDRFPRRSVLFFTQSAAMLLAFLLGALTLAHLAAIWNIALLAFLLGAVTAVDAPARQAFTVELVGKEFLPSAIALNSSIFNGARVIGPSLAGFLIAFVGTGGAFMLNGVSYIAVIIALFFIDVPFSAPPLYPSPVQAVKEGLGYSWRHPIIRTLLGFTVINSVFGWSYTTMLPVIAQNTFHTGAAGLGYLYAASGLGALLATVLVSGLSGKVSNVVFIVGGTVLFAASIIAFTFTSVMGWAMVFLFISGTGLIASFATVNSTLQRMVEDRYRGRVMSIYTLAFLGLTPLGNLLVGYLSEHYGTGLAIRFGAMIVLVGGLLLLAYRKRIRGAYQRYQATQPEKI